MIFNPFKLGFRVGLCQKVLFFQFARDEAAQQWDRVKAQHFSFNENFAVFFEGVRKLRPAVFRDFEILFL